MSWRKRKLYCIILLVILICTGCEKKTEISKSEAFSEATKRISSEQIIRVISLKPPAANLCVNG